MNRSILHTLVGVAIGVCVAVPIGIAAFGNSFNVILPTAIGGGAIGFFIAESMRHG